MRDKILEFIRTHEAMKTADIVHEVRIKASVARQIIEDLEDEGLIIEFNGVWIMANSIAKKVTCGAWDSALF